MQPRRKETSEGLTHNPFAALRPKGAPEPQAPKVEPTASAETPALPAGTRLVVRREKRGRGGKTVTRVAGLPLPPAALLDLAGRMKRALGCGASVEEGEVILQGALTERAAHWLETHLEARVTLGN